MGRYKSQLGFTVGLVMLGSSLGAATPAQANFQVCNQFNTTAFVAVGYSAGADRWYSQGWWEIPQGQCSTILSGTLQVGTYFYLYAFNQEGTRIWQGDKQTTWFCIKPTENFQLVSGNNQCLEAGSSKKTFWEIQITQPSQTVNLN